MLRLKEQDLKLTLKQMEEDIRKECRNEYQNLHNRYLDLKIEHEQLENKYVKLLQDYQISEARLKEYQEETQLNEMASNLLKDMKK